MVFSRFVSTFLFLYNHIMDPDPLRQSLPASCCRLLLLLLLLLTVRLVEGVQHRALVEPSRSFLPDLVASFLPLTDGLKMSEVCQVHRGQCESVLCTVFWMQNEHMYIKKKEKVQTTSQSII